MLTSVHACTATNSTLRSDASSKAISVASSDAAEKSIPTTIGAVAGRNTSGSSSRNHRDRALRMVDQTVTDRAPAGLFPASCVLGNPQPSSRPSSRGRSGRKRGQTRAIPSSPQGAMLCGAVRDSLLRVFKDLLTVRLLPFFVVLGHRESRPRWPWSASDQRGDVHQIERNIAHRSFPRGPSHCLGRVGDPSRPTNLRVCLLGCILKFLLEGQRIPISGAYL